MQLQRSDQGEQRNIWEYLTKPKLQHVNVQRTIYQGQPIFLINNSLKLTDTAIALPQTLGAVSHTM